VGGDRRHRRRCPAFAVGAFRTACRFLVRGSRTPRHQTLGGRGSPPAPTGYRKRDHRDRRLVGARDASKDSRAERAADRDPVAAEASGGALCLGIIRAELGMSQDTAAKSVRRLAQSWRGKSQHREGTRERACLTERPLNSRTRGLRRIARLRILKGAGWPPCSTGEASDCCAARRGMPARLHASDAEGGSIMGSHSPSLVRQASIRLD
jgi:hypothetical protein